MKRVDRTLENFSILHTTQDVRYFPYKAIKDEQHCVTTRITPIPKVAQ